MGEQNRGFVDATNEPEEEAMAGKDFMKKDKIKTLLHESEKQERVKGQLPLPSH